MNHVGWCAVWLWNERSKHSGDECKLQCLSIHFGRFNELERMRVRGRAWEHKFDYEAKMPMYEFSQSPHHSTHFNIYHSTRITKYKWFEPLTKYRDSSCNVYTPQSPHRRASATFEMSTVCCLYLLRSDTNTHECQSHTHTHSQCAWVLGNVQVFLTGHIQVTH